MKIDAGRAAGILILAQVAAGLVLNFGLPEAWFGLKPLIAFLTAAMGLGVAMAVYPVFTRLSQRLGLTYLILASMTATLLVIETGASLAYADDAVLRPIWFWAHYVQLFVAGTGFLILFGTLYRFRLVPRWLAGFGMLATTSQLVAVSMPYFGLSVVLPMLAPLALTLIVLGVWLLSKGFRS